MTLWINVVVVDGPGSKKDRRRWQLLNGQTVLSTHRSEQAALDAHDRAKRSAK